MTQEKKAKAYDEALETCKRVFNFNNLSYTHCEIDEKLKQIFPELAESEDERIGNLIYCLIRDRSDNGKLLEANGCSVEKALAWLEKQCNLMKCLRKTNAEIGRLVEENYYLKEQKPAEWSEEDANLLNRTLSIIRWASDSDRTNRIIGDEGAIELEDWLKSLRPQPHWKPSEEQMVYLKEAINKFDFCDAENAGLQALYEQLKKL